MFSITCMQPCDDVPKLGMLAQKTLKNAESSHSVDHKSYTELETNENPIKGHDQLDGNGTGCLNEKNKDKPVGCTDQAVFVAMRYEINRLKSYFGKWELRSVSPSDLASVGLFYLGQHDHVQCAFCRGIIADWKDYDRPVREHAQHFPMCPLILGCNVGNVPVSGKNGQLKWQIEGARPEHYAPNCPDARTYANQYLTKYPAMNHMDRRLSTFYKWKSTVVDKHRLSECGFFYSGVSDIVTCFCCGGSLNNWEPGDDPWVEHTKHFPHCAFIKYCKGTDFVENIKNGAETSSTPSNAAENNTDVLQKPQTADLKEQQDLAINVCQETVKVSPSKKPMNHLCKICMEEKPRVVFLPCGHSLACPDCAVALKNCPMCRQKVESSVRIYFD